MKTQLVAVAALIAFGAPLGSAAQAYRTYADDPAIAYPARWDAGDVTWELDEASFGSRHTIWRELVRSAFAAWTPARCMSSQVRFMSAPSSTSPSAGDGHNSVVMVMSGWAGSGRPDRAAFVDLQLERAEGASPGSPTRIVEADVYLNGENFQFDVGDGVGNVDALAVLTHEVGHFVGLLHPCEFDELGVPDCAGGDVAWSQSAVFPVYMTTQRLVSMGDEQGLCALYGMPTSSDGGTELRDASADDAGVYCDPVVCASACVHAADCTVGTCALVSDRQNTCVSIGDYGAPCEFADDCRSGVCLRGLSSGRQFCSRPCTEDTTCGSRMSCGTVDGLRACIPSAGCTALPGRRGNVSILWFLSIAMMMWRRFR